MKAVSELNAAILAADLRFSSEASDAWRMSKARDRLLLDEAVRFGLATQAQIDAMSPDQLKALMQEVYDLPDDYEAWKQKQRQSGRGLTLIEGGLADA
jgi:hypothetical protein